MCIRDSGYGELRCIQASDGSRARTDTTAVRKARSSNAHFVQHHDKVWIFNEEVERILSKLCPEGFTLLSRALLKWICVKGQHLTGLQTLPISRSLRSLC